VEIHVADPPSNPPGSRRSFVASSSVSIPPRRTFMSDIWWSSTSCAIFKTRVYTVVVIIGDYTGLIGRTPADVRKPGRC